MNAWNSLVKTALLGTGNGFTTPAAPEPFQSVLALFPQNDAALFSSAALIGLASIAGTTPRRLETVDPGSPRESQQIISEEASAFLKRILGGEHPEVLSEFLALTALHKHIVPPETLPALLGLGKHKLRKLVLPVIGERGKWLAGQNPAWAYALGREEEEDVWQNGARLERVQYLERLRERDPKRAVELIRSTWDQDPPEERAALIAALSIGLSMDDELFLESCLDDPRKEVRESALDLLICLPRSRHAERMSAGLAPFLEYKSQMIGGDSLHVNLPDEVDAGAKRDGVSGATLLKRLGRKANLLAQMISLMPPSFWSRKWKQPPERILRAALKSEWKNSLLLGWLLATERSKDADWAGALAEILVKQTDGREAFAEWDVRGITNLIPMEKMEVLAKSSIVKALKELGDVHRILILLEAYEVPWSEALTRTVMSSVQRQVGQSHWKLMRSLPAFGLRIPISSAETFLKGWPDDPKGWGTWIDQFCAVLRFRRDMTKTLNHR